MNQAEQIFSQEFMGQDQKEQILQQKARAAEAELAEKQAQIEAQELTFNTPHVFNRVELLALLKTYSQSIKKEDRLMVGTVGYPKTHFTTTTRPQCFNTVVGNEEIGQQMEYIS